VVSTVDLALYPPALTALSQQAADQGLSPVEWIASLSTDAADGVFDEAALASAQSLQAARDEFLRGPYNPIGLPDDAPDSLEAISQTEIGKLLGGWQKTLSE